MDLGLRGRTAIVCGASAGIGLGCAEALAAEGANVVLFARRGELLEREYGIDGLYMGVPVVLGAKGIERIVELDLDEAEQQALKASADAVRDVVAVLSS